MALIMNFEIPAISLSLSQTPIPKHSFQHALTLNELKVSCIENLLWNFWIHIFCLISATRAGPYKLVHCQSPNLLCWDQFREHV